MKNTKHMGKHERKMYEFCQKYPGLHSLAKDALTQRTAHRLVQRGLIAVNEYNQMRLKP